MRSKLYFTHAFALISAFVLHVSAQVGIGTETPRGAVDINTAAGTNTAGLVLPTNDSPNDIINPNGGTVAPGTIIYDSTSECIKFANNAGGFSDCISTATTGISLAEGTLDCNTGTAVAGTLTQGESASGATKVINVTPTAAGLYTIVSQANDLTWFATGTFTQAQVDAATAVAITLQASGAPSTEGTTTFTVDFEGSTSCSFDATIEAGSTGGGTTDLIATGGFADIGYESRVFIFSSQDSDYLPFNGPTPGISAADGNTSTNASEVAINRVTSLNVRGDNTTATGSSTSFNNEIIRRVRYWSVNGDDIPGGVIDIEIPSEYVASGGTTVRLEYGGNSGDSTADNNVQLGVESVDLILSQGTEANGELYTFTYRIYAVGSPITFVGLDINSDLGEDYLGVLLGTFTTPWGDIELRLHPGIPDAGAADGQHPFVYVPVMDYAGQTWLRTNLGAEYSRVGSSDFNPNIQLDHELEYFDSELDTDGSLLTNDTNKNLLAGGSSFIYGRPSDGHEFVNVGLDGSNNVVKASTTFGGAGLTAVSGGWDTSATGGANNPCPLGFRVPTLGEWGVMDEFTATRYSGSVPYGRYYQTPLQLGSAFRWNSVTGGVPAANLGDWAMRYWNVSGGALGASGGGAANGVRCILNVQLQ